MLAKLFSYSNNAKIDFSKELIGGVVNFVAIAYIIIVNPMILNANGAGFPISPAITSTIIAIIITTMLASFVIKLPFVLAPGMGVNAIISYTFILHDKLDIATILGVVLFSSILLFVFSLTKIRELIIRAIPECLQVALGAGIGVFLFLIGVRNARIIVSNYNTIVTIGHFDYLVVLSLLGFILATVLFIKQKKYAFLLPIILVTIVYMIINPSAIPQQLVKYPDFSLFMHMNVFSALKLSVIPAILSLFIVNFFDATSTVIGLLGQLDTSFSKDKKRYLKRSLVIDSVGGIISGFIGTAPSVIFIESSAAIQNGAVTGIASMVTALLCIPFLFFSPLIAMVPSAATSPILMLVGILMLCNLRRLKLAATEDMFVVIITIIMMPLCFSITDGAILGIVTYTILKLALGKFREVSPIIVILAVIGCVWLGSS